MPCLMGGTSCCSSVMFFQSLFRAGADRAAEIELEKRNAHASSASCHDSCRFNQSSRTKLCYAACPLLSLWRRVVGKSSLEDAKRIVEAMTAVSSSTHTTKKNICFHDTHTLMTPSHSLDENLLHGVLVVEVRCWLLLVHDGVENNHDVRYSVGV